MSRFGFFGHLSTSCRKGSLLKPLRHACPLIRLLMVADSGLATQQYGQAKSLLTKYSEALKARRSTAAGSAGFLRWVCFIPHPGASAG
jgi:hypothetical protein